MPVTEIGLLKRKDSIAADDSDMLAGLAEAKEAIEKFCGGNSQFYYLQQTEDPAFIYLVGEWASIAQHNTALHATDEWKAGVAKMSRFFQFQWQSHFDVPLADISPLLLHAPLLSLERHMVREGRRGDFAREFAARGSLLDGFVTEEGRAAGGWQLEDERQCEQFALLVPWKDVAQHDGFRKTEEFREYSKINDFVTEVEVRHVHLMKDL